MGRWGQKEGKGRGQFKLPKGHLKSLVFHVINDFSFLEEQMGLMDSGPCSEKSVLSFFFLKDQLLPR